MVGHLDRWLPSWRDTPGEINLPVLLWLHNLLEAWDLESYAKARYRLLGQGSHWFPDPTPMLSSVMCPNSSSWRPDSQSMA